MMMMVVMTTLSGRQALCASSYLCTCCPPNTVFPRRTSSALARQDNILVFFPPSILGPAFWCSRIVHGFVAGLSISRCPDSVGARSGGVSSFFFSLLGLGRGVEAAAL